MIDKRKSLEEFQKLLDIMDELRVKCPWDMKQTNQTLRKLTIEETYELAEAVFERDVNTFSVAGFDNKILHEVHRCIIILIIQLIPVQGCQLRVIFVVAFHVQCQIPGKVNLGSKHSLD